MRSKNTFLYYSHHFCANCVVIVVTLYSTAERLQSGQQRGRLGGWALLQYAPLSGLQTTVCPVGLLLLGWSHAVTCAMETTIPCNIIIINPSKP